jgi:hypothetical protein
VLILVQGAIPLCVLLLWLVLTCAVAIPTGRADETWVNLELRLDPGRAGHSFSLLVPYTSSAANGSLQQGGLIEIATAGQSHSLLQVSISPNETFTLWDDTAGEAIDLTAPAYNDLVDLRSAVWGLPDPVMGNYGTSFNRRYFLVGPERANHSFLLSANNAWFAFTLPIGRTVFNAAGAVRHEFLLNAMPSADFWFIDLATNHRSATREMNLALSEWTPNTVTLPVGQIGLFLDANQVGQQFTLHSRVVGGGMGPEQLLNFAALDCLNGSWANGSMDEDFLYTWDHLGAPLIIPEGAGYETATVGFGMDFCLTRKSDGAISPLMQMDGAGGHWSLLGVFGPPPAPPRITVRYAPYTSVTTFRYFDNSPGYEEINLNPDSNGTLYSYDDYGNQNGSAEYVIVHFDLPEGTTSWSCHDYNSGGQRAATPAAPLSIS